jgi:hypothetical protein
VLIGYMRVSRADGSQALDLQRDALLGTGIPAGQLYEDHARTSIGVINATALVAAIGRGEAFDRARDLPAWLGIVARQATTGGKPRLLGITKRGNRYLRKLLIHGARAALPSISQSNTPLGAWLRGLLARRYHKVAVVAPRPNLWPAPLQGEFRTIRSKQSAPTYPVSGSGPGQDGDPSAPVLITVAVSTAPLGLSGFRNAGRLSGYLV